MKFNIAYFGPEAIYHLRRDFILAVKYGLEDLGHSVSITGKRLESDAINLLIGAYFLPPDKIRAISKLDLQFAHINTEIISYDMLNFNPEKTDFLGAYLPSIKCGLFAWDVVPENMVEYEKYCTTAHLLRWGWNRKTEDIDHRTDKDLDFYFFGTLSQRRLNLINDLIQKGLKGLADHSCPYFQRNDFISRAKIQLNIIQEDFYDHVNGFRICYLANNRCAIVSEKENDPIGYLDAVKVANRNDFFNTVKELTLGNGWHALSEKIYEDFRRKPSMKENLEELLDISLI